MTTPLKDVPLSATTATQEDEPRAQVIIVGAGPVGLFLALKIAQQGIKVIVMDCEMEIVKSPRAIAYFPIVLNEMEKVGIFDDVIKASIPNKEGIWFRTPYTKSNEVLATLKVAKIPKGGLRYNFVATNLGQDELAALILSHAEKLENFDLRWSHRFAGLKQDENGVTVCAVTPKGEKFFHADYVIACDGAGSAVRRSLCIPFEGITWDDYRFVATNVKYDFVKHGYGVANMIVDEEDWAVIGQVSKDVWRVAYGEPAHLSEQEIKDRLAAKYERLLPGPRPLKYEVVSANPYWAHQRCAAKFREGRVVLCGDAGHSNNPIGGLGLTTGLLDAATLGNCLIRVIVKGEPDALLSKYAESRRNAWLEVTNKESTAFKHRVSSMRPEHVKEREQFFDALNNNPDVHLHIANSMNEVLEDLSAD